MISFLEEMTQLTSDPIKRSRLYIRMDLIILFIFGRKPEKMLQKT